MRISTKGRYGARAVLELAGNYNNRRMRANEIAESQGISLKYLEALLSTLKSACVIVSERGKNGGYSLARPPAEITLFDVLRPLEETLAFVHCTVDPSKCPRLQTCVTREVWMELKEATDRILKRTSLDQLLERQRVLRTQPTQQQQADKEVVL